MKKKSELVQSSLDKHLQLAFLPCIGFKKALEECFAYNCKETVAPHGLCSKWKDTDEKSMPGSICSRAQTLLQGMKHRGEARLLAICWIAQTLFAAHEAPKEARLPWPSLQISEFSPSMCCQLYACQGQPCHVCPCRGSPGNIAQQEDSLTIRRH